jgi:hypothetical protein
MGHSLVRDLLRAEQEKEEKLKEKVMPGKDIVKKGVSVYSKSPTTFSGVPRLRTFSLLVDFNTFPNESFYNFGDYYNGFTKLFGELRKHGEFPLEFHCADSHLFTLSDKFHGYYWGECEFIYKKVLEKELEKKREKWGDASGIHQSLRENVKVKEFKDMIHRVSFWGYKPVGVNSGSDFCAFLYPSKFFFTYNYTKFI